MQPACALSDRRSIASSCVLKQTYIASRLLYSQNMRHSMGISTRLRGAGRSLFMFCETGFLSFVVQGDPLDWYPLFVFSLVSDERICVRQTPRRPRLRPLRRKDYLTSPEGQPHQASGSGSGRYASICGSASFLAWCCRCHVSVLSLSSC